MPFTPFHFGPGTLAKSVAPRFFSLRAYIVTQVVIDCETAWNIWNKNDRLHTFFHTYLGSVVAMTLIAGLLFGYNKVISHAFSREPTNTLIKKFDVNSAFVGVLLGGLSHVLLDSIMHADVRPFFPFSDANPHLRMISVFDLHLYCLAGFAGAAIVYTVRVLIALIHKLVRRKSIL